MDIIPEAAIVLGAGVAGMGVEALKTAFPSQLTAGRVPLLSILVGIAVAVLLYAGNVVDGGGNVARMVLAGFAIAGAASGGQSWYRATTRARESGTG